MDHQGKVIFDNGPLGGETVFSSPKRVIVANEPEDVPVAFEALHKATDEGNWLAGYFSYELGYCFEQKLLSLIPRGRATPLLAFGVFDAPASVRPAQRFEPSYLSLGEPAWSFGRYEARYSDVIADLAVGEIYQANMTFPIHATYSGTPIALFHALRARQDVPYGAFVDLGGPVLLSRSPELFFVVDEAGKISTKPMKGTAPRGASSRTDEVRLAKLQNSEKDRAENIMIVDLVRNDLSRIAEVGSVKVTELCSVETYTTLFQMTSEIVAKLPPRIRLHDIIQALFPSGSITGAPKMRAMEKIRKLEDVPRDAYCGSIGWVSPKGAMQFNVAIRTLLCFDDGTARLNVGGGITYDSVVEQEYAEALTKSRFAKLPDLIC